MSSYMLVLKLGIDVSNTCAHSATKYARALNDARYGYSFSTFVCMVCVATMGHPLLGAGSVTTALTALNHRRLHGGHGPLCNGVLPISSVCQEECMPQLILVICHRACNPRLLAKQTVAAQRQASPVHAVAAM